VFFQTYYYYHKLAVTVTAKPQYTALTNDGHNN